MIKDEIKEVVVKKDNYLTELKNTQELCSLLMQQAHYKNMGEVGIFAIVETAKSLNIDPRQALGGGLYFVKGRVEMSARMMAALIRSKKHSITRNGKSDDTICMLSGKRSDNGDEWKESFSIEEAKKAGIYKNAWITFPRDMLYARALSRLARQLFPDIIGNCYVEGEISLDPNIKDNGISHNEVVEVVEISKKRTKEEVDELVKFFNEVPEYREEIESFLIKKEMNGFEDMPQEMYNKVLKRAKEKVMGVTNEED